MAMRKSSSSSSHSSSPHRRSHSSKTKTTHSSSKRHSHAKGATVGVLKKANKPIVWNSLLVAAGLGAAGWAIKKYAWGKIPLLPESFGGVPDDEKRIYGVSAESVAEQGIHGSFDSDYDYDEADARANHY